MTSVATDRCYAADAGSPAGPRGGPAGQRDRVAPGARSGGSGRRSPPCDWPLESRAAGSGEVTWGRRTVRLVQSGSVWWCVWCGAEVHFGRWRRRQYIPG